jgi:hypothetical protein
MVISKISQKRHEKGQSMVELAVSLVVLLILLAGIVDLGRLAFHYIAMRDAAQEGASYGIINPTDCAQIESRIRAGLVDEAVLLPNGNPRFIIDIRITPGKSGIDDDGDDFTIQCAYNTGYTQHACEGHGIQVEIIDQGFPITMPLIGAFVGQSIGLETTIRDTIIRPQCESAGG